MTTRPYAWREWFQAQSLELAGDMAGGRMDLFSMATQAALCGLGAALVPHFFVEQEIAKGELIVPLTPAPFVSGLGYYLIHPEGEPTGAGFDSVRAWILEQTGAFGS